MCFVADTTLLKTGESHGYEIEIPHERFRNDPFGWSVKETLNSQHYFVSEMKRSLFTKDSIPLPCTNSRKFFYQKSTIGTAIAAIEVNNDMYCFQKGIEKFPLMLNVTHQIAWIVAFLANTDFLKLKNSVTARNYSKIQLKAQVGSFIK